MDCPPAKEKICAVNLGNILDEDLTTEAEVEELRRNFEDIVLNLESTVLAADYPFVYKTKAGDYYYWIPLEDMY